MKITQDNSGSEALEKLADQIKKSKLEVGFLNLLLILTVRVALWIAAGLFIGGYPEGDAFRRVYGVFPRRKL